MRNNNRVSFIDLSTHQAARRDALSLGQVPSDDGVKEPSLNSFLWALFGILCSLILVLWYLKP